jgi:hypothetical protein
LRAIQSLGWPEISAEIKTAIDREQQLLCEIAENENRKEFTYSERVAYGKELEQIQALKAKQRMESGNNQFTPSIDGCYPSEKGKTDEIVGKKVGMSLPSYRRAKRVVESGNKEVIEKMDKG